MCRREGLLSLPTGEASTAPSAPAQASTSLAPEQRWLTLRVPPVALAVPLLAAAAYAVMQTAPWRARAALPGAETAAASPVEPPREVAADEAEVERVADEAEPRGMADVEPERTADVEPVAEVEPPPAPENAPAPEAPRGPSLARAEGGHDTRRAGADQAQLARALEEVVVTVYYAPWCGYCRAARAFLARRGIRSVEHDVDKDPAASARHQRLNPRGSVPTIDIDGQVLVGFDAGSIERALIRAARARLQRERGS